MNENGESVDYKAEHRTKEKLGFYDEPENQKWYSQMYESHDTKRW
jgi:hypothetical protein